MSVASLVALATGKRSDVSLTQNVVMRGCVSNDVLARARHIMFYLKYHLLKKSDTKLSKNQIAVTYISDTNGKLYKGSVTTR